MWCSYHETQIPEPELVHVCNRDDTLWTIARIKEASVKGMREANRVGAMIMSDSSVLPSLLCLLSYQSLLVTWSPCSPVRKASLV
jgi:hypothetical protein